MYVRFTSVVVRIARSFDHIVRTVRIGHKSFDLAIRSATDRTDRAGSIGPNYAK